LGGGTDSVQNDDFLSRCAPLPRRALRFGDHAGAPTARSFNSIRSHCADLAGGSALPCLLAGKAARLTSVPCLAVGAARASSPHPPTSSDLCVQRHTLTRLCRVVAPPAAASLRFERHTADGRNTAVPRRSAAAAGSGRVVPPRDAGAAGGCSACRGISVLTHNTSDGMTKGEDRGYEWRSSDCSNKSKQQQQRQQEQQQQQQQQQLQQQHEQQLQQQQQKTQYLQLWTLMLLNVEHMTAAGLVFASLFALKAWLFARIQSARARCGRVCVRSAGRAELLPHRTPPPAPSTNNPSTATCNITTL
jgi:hypothetical protein